jgi:protein-disulfide isomerase
MDLMHENRALGPLDAPIQIDIFMDFQCAHCSQLNAIWQDIQNRLKKDSNIRIVFRIFTLEGHHQAWRASILALASAREQQFFRAKDRLFETRAQWSLTGDVDAVLSDVLSNYPLISRDEVIAAAKSLIRADAAEGALLGVRAAPTVVLRSKFLKNPRILVGAMSQTHYLKELNEFAKNSERATNEH